MRFIVNDSAEGRIDMFKKIALGVLAILVVVGSGLWFSLDKETRGVLATLPTNSDLLFWSQASATPRFVRSTGCHSWRRLARCRRAARRCRCRRGRR